jgi:hypothetical protein
MFVAINLSPYAVYVPELLKTRIVSLPLVVTVGLPVDVLE